MRVISIVFIFLITRVFIRIEEQMLHAAYGID
ncbi:MAG: hypothetical protein BMS9Abin05_0017 [Rhodothermia bacterium]|nr:MAG: hypothetical protein BMS9Abin05_0017 [Rhodothermia bacterium]